MSTSVPGAISGGPGTSNQKPSQTTGNTRPSERDRWEEVSDKDFLTTYLPAAGVQEQHWSQELSVLVDKIKQTSSNEETLYTGKAPLLRLLNAVSWQVFHSLPNHAAPRKALVFRSCHRTTIHNPFGGSYFDLEPDIVVLKENAHIFALEDLTNLQQPLDFSCQSVPTWHNLVAAGEVKVKKDQKGVAQLTKSLRNHLQNRPDRSAVLGLTSLPQGYRLLYHDASVIHVSPLFKWTTGPLYAFVERLYADPFGDPSMAMLGAENPVPTWAIRDEQDVFVSRDATPNMGPGQRRFIGMMRHIDTKVDYFFKDVWRDRRGRFFEAALCNKAHEGKHLPGLMEVTRSGYVLDERGDQIRTTPLLEPRPGGPIIPIRDKIRLYTLDVGEPLKNVKTVREFLCVMYDVCVVQRNMYRKSKILHKDISEGNIMVAPSDEAFYQRCADGSDEVKYINQMLAQNCNAKPRPACLLVDFGHSADLDAVQGDPEALAERTGTPKFMARSVSSGQLLRFQAHPSTYVQMPTLEARAHKLYQSAYSKERYDEFTELVKWGHMQPVQPKGSKVPFTHRLFHDAESVFWVISWLLACSTCPGYEQESWWPPQLEKFVSGMEQHRPFGMIDTREQAMYDEAEDWEGVLHSDLGSLASMLAGMSSYVFPEWAFRADLKDEPEHVHEALMRLLLKEIVRLEGPNDIKLEVGNRVLPKVSISRPSIGGSTTVSRSAVLASQPSKKGNKSQTTSESTQQGNQSAGREAPKEAHEGLDPVDSSESVKPRVGEIEWPKLSYKLQRLV